MLELDSYNIPRDLLEKILRIVGDACFIYLEDGETINDETVGDVYDALLTEIVTQQLPKRICDL